MAKEWTVECDIQKFNQMTQGIVHALGMSFKQQLPYVAGTIVKGAMNDEKLPGGTVAKAKEKMQRLARKKASFAMYLDYKSNKRGTIDKNIYINTGKKPGKTHLVVRNPYTGKTHYPTYRDEYGDRIWNFNDTNEAFAKSMVDEWKRLTQQIYKQELNSMYLPKAVWYDILLSLQWKTGVDLDYISPKAWSGGRKKIEEARQHNGGVRIQKGFASRVSDFDGDYVLTVANYYYRAKERNMKSRLNHSANKFSRKVLADFKHGTFENMERTAARYPWVEFRST